MKKLIAVMLCALMILGLAACGKPEADNDAEGKDMLQTIKDKGYITIATEGDWAPYTYHDENDVLTGFDVELGKRIAEGLGVEARFEETPWDSILAGVDAGRFDIACNGVGWMEDRAEKYYMSNPYVYMGTVLVVRNDNTDIKDFEDLEGKTTANTASSTYAIMAEDYGATNIPIDTLADTINLLVEGRIDATVNAAGAIADYLTQHPDANIKVVAVTSDDVEEDCVPLPKKDEAKTLLDAINTIIEDLRANGKLAEMSVRYFGADYTNK